MSLLDLLLNNSSLGQRKKEVKNPALWKDLYKLLDDKKYSEIISGFENKKWPWIYEHIKSDGDTVKICVLVQFIKRGLLGLFSKLLPHMPSDVRMEHRGVPFTHFLSSKGYRTPFLKAWLDHCTKSAPERLELETSAHNHPTALACAAIKENSSAITLLLRSGASASAKSDDIRLPIILCAQRGMISSVQELLREPGMEIETADDDGHTLLHWAVSRDQANMVVFLLNMGANPQRRDKEDITPLERAYKNNSKSCAKILGNWIDMIVDLKRHNLPVPDYTHCTAQ